MDKISYSFFSPLSFPFFSFLFLPPVPFSLSLFLHFCHYSNAINERRLSETEFTTALRSIRALGIAIKHVARVRAFRYAKSRGTF